MINEDLNISVPKEVVEMLLSGEEERYSRVMEVMLNELMKMEREQAVGAGAYERSLNRKGYANGFKPKTVI